MGIHGNPENAKKNDRPCAVFPLARKESNRDQKQSLREGSRRVEMQGGP